MSEQMWGMRGWLGVASCRCDCDGYRPDTAKELLESTEYDEYRR